MKVVFEVELETLQCASCQMTWAIPADFMKIRRRDHAMFYCPAGHSNVYPQQSDIEKARADLAQARQNEAMHEEEKASLRNQLQMAVNTANELRKASRRTAKRISNGTCPDCNRTFANVARHMVSKHRKMVCGAAS